MDTTDQTTITILVHIDQHAAIRAGVGGASSTARMQVTLSDLTDAQRNALADWLDSSLTLDRSWRLVQPTMDELRRVLDPIAQRRAAEAAAEEAKKARRAAAEAARETETFSLNLSASGQVRANTKFESDVHSRTATRLRWLAGMSDEYRAERDAQTAAAIAEYERDAPAIVARIEAEREAERVEKERIERERVEARDAWIAQHGSARLREMLALGLYVGKLYQSEHAAKKARDLDARLPGWTYYKPHWDPLHESTKLVRTTRVTVDALAALREAREIDPEACLYHDEDRDGCRVMAKIDGDHAWSPVYEYESEDDSE
jgi:hypothetical protein